MTLENGMMLLCGLGFFLFGMKLMGDGLELTAGSRLKSLVERLTTNKYMGALVGLLVTAVIQSSSATTVMVVGFVNAGIMNLAQAVGVIMGANIGTTVTSFLIAIKLNALAPLAIFLGVILMQFSKKVNRRHVGQIITGFGVLFYGMSVMSSSMEPLSESEFFRNAIVQLRNPILGLLVGLVFTAIIQSSSASVGILQSLAAAGLVPFSAAIYIIMGQNIGTCVTAILSSLGAKRTAKTAALMHLLFNIIGTIIFSTLAIIYFQVFEPVWANGLITQTEISVVHTAFNICTTVLLFPVSDWIIKLAKKIGRVEEAEQDESQVQLDERVLQTPGLALQSTVNEVARMGQIVEDSLMTAKNVLFTLKESDIKFLKEEEATVDRLSAGITNYAIKLGALQISEKEHQDIAHLLQIISDMERISDYCENISEFAETLYEKKTSFSEIGTEQIREMMEVCADSYRYALKAFVDKDRAMALKVIEKETQADNLELSLRSKHIKRLANNQCQAEAGVVYLDTLVCLERISDHARNIAEEVLEQNA